MRSDILFYLLFKWILRMIISLDIVSLYTLFRWLLILNLVVLGQHTVLCVLRYFYALHMLKYRLFYRLLDGLHCNFELDLNITLFDLNYLNIRTILIIKHNNIRVFPIILVNFLIFPLFLIGTFFINPTYQLMLISYMNLIWLLIMN